MNKAIGNQINTECYSRHLENSIDPALIVDNNGKFINVNSAACRFLGYSKEELLSMSIGKLVANEERERKQVAFAEFRKTGINRGEIILVTRGGSHIPVELSAFMNCQGQYVVYFHDISKRKETERVLEEAIHLFKLITNNMLDVITIIDRNGKIKYASPSYRNLLGYSPWRILGKDFLDFIHPEDVAKCESEIALVINARQFGKVECRFKNANDNYVWLEIIGTISLDSQGQVEGGILCSRDIGERKFSEEMLRDSEERYRRLVELLPDGILVVSNEQIVFANKSAKVLLGVNDDQTLIDREYKSIIHPDYISFFKEKVRNTGPDTPLLEGKYIRNDGESIDVELTGINLNYQGQSADLIVFRDVSERKRSEASLEETRKTLFEREKMALIGQMAAGMAHEIRNPLTSVRGYAQLLKIKNYDKDKINSYMDIIIGEIDRVNNLISDFLQLARPKEPDLKIQSVEKLINEFLEIFLPHALLNNIEVSYEIENLYLPVYWIKIR